MSIFWNQHGKYSKMNTNKPMFGPGVLEIACDVVTNKIIELIKTYILSNIKHLLCIKIGINYSIEGCVYDLLYTYGNSDIVINTTKS